MLLSCECEEAENFMRDVSHIGHWGTGDLEVLVRNTCDLEKAKELITLSYERS